MKRNYIFDRCSFSSNTNKKKSHPIDKAKVEKNLVMIFFSLSLLRWVASSSSLEMELSFSHYIHCSMSFKCGKTNLVTCSCNIIVREKLFTKERKMVHQPHWSLLFLYSLSLCYAIAVTVLDTLNHSVGFLGVISAWKHCHINNVVNKAADDC